MPGGRAKPTCQWSRRLRRACDAGRGGRARRPGVEQGSRPGSSGAGHAAGVTWLAEVDGQLVGMMNPAIPRGCPGQGHMPAAGDTWQRFALRPTRARGSAAAVSANSRAPPGDTDRGEAMQLPAFALDSCHLSAIRASFCVRKTCPSVHVDADLHQWRNRRYRRFGTGLRRYQARGQAAKRSRSRAISSWLSPNGAKIPSAHLSRRRPASAKSRRVSPGSSRRAKLITWSML